jgi:DNA-binding SARP family transcriptional activator/TolB-like protein
MIELLTLGPIGLRHADGRDIAQVLAQPKRTALLACLAAANPGGYVRRDTLLALLWPEHDEARARAALSKALHHLRRALGPDVIVTRGADDVGLDPTLLWSDIAAFTDAVRKDDAAAALALYRGELLLGFHLTDAPEFARWLDDARMAARTSAHAVATRAATAAERAGDAARAVVFARQAAALLPADEPTTRRLLELLVLAGDRAGAIAAYETFARRLHEDLELAPSPETAALAAQIRQSTRSSTNREHGGEPAAAAAGRGAESPRGPAVEPVAGRAPARESQSLPPHPPIPTARRRALPWAIAAAVVVLAGVASVRVDPDPVPEGGVLVLPFENLTGDDALDALGVLAADWVVQGLARTGLANVVDPVTTLFISEAASRPALAQLARYGVRYVVTGTFHQRGDSLWFAAQLSDVASGSVLRSIRPVAAPSVEPADVLDELRARVLGAIAAVTDTKLATLAPNGSEPPTFPAYQEFVAGLHAFRSDVASSIPYFLRAAEQDTSFTLALLWAALAAQHSGAQDTRRALLERVGQREAELAPVDLLAFRYLRATADRDTVAAFDTRARLAELAPQSFWAYEHAFELIRQRRYAAAVEILERIDPDVGWIASWQVPYYNMFGWALHELGAFERGVEIALERQRRLSDRAADGIVARFHALAGRHAELEAALGRLDDEPLDALSTRVWAATELHTHGHAGLAREVLRAGLARLDALPPAQQAGPEGRRLRAEMLYGTGEWAQAERLFRELYEADPSDHELLMHIGTSAAQQGNRAEAERVIAELELSGMTFGQHHVLQARIASVLGQRGRAIEFLEKSVAAGFVLGNVAHGLDFDSIRHMPERRTLVRPAL